MHQVLINCRVGYLYLNNFNSQKIVGNPIGIENLICEFPAENLRKIHRKKTKPPSVLRSGLRTQIAAARRSVTGRTGIVQKDQNIISEAYITKDNSRGGN